MNSFIDLIKYPILTEKAVRLFKQNQCSFAVSKKANKTVIKTAIETLFDVKVISVNTLTQQRKKRRVGKFVGEKTQNKKAIVTLRPGDSINIINETN
jgi:large subunit ribosomal protein L23